MPVLTKAGDRAVFFIPSRKLCTGGRNRRGREDEMERREEKRDKWQEIKYGRERRALHNLQTWCSQVTLFPVASFDSLLDHSESAPTRKGF